MTKLYGKTVHKGIVAGRIYVLKEASYSVKRVLVDDTEAELRRFGKAKEKAAEQLVTLYEKAVEEAGKDQAAVFEVHRMMLEDEKYTDAICSMIVKEAVNAEYAVEKSGDYFADMFADMKDDYMKARSADVKDISKRLVGILDGFDGNDHDIQEPSIIIADDLSPSETVQMDKEKILALVTVRGSVHSHAAILARTMNIPALVRVPMDLNTIKTGMWAIVDGNQGTIILDPDTGQIAQAKKQMEEEQRRSFLLDAVRGKETVTAGGKKINLCANIGSVGDVAYALENDAEGIGLFRSEFLYIGRDTFPTEEEQFQAYRQVLKAMAGKKVIVRTLDIGADKQADYFNLGKEENPALGYRGIRICLSKPDVFKTQLRALLRAAVYGNLSVMYPMITSVWEVKRIQEIMKEVCQELKDGQIPYTIPEQGIMIETPAAVMISDELAEITDFFSIGTNDLTQYTLAIDRQNEKLDDFYDSRHPAVLRMIKMTVDNAHKHGKWVGICGELGADTEMTERFVEMGIDELSVSPSMVLKVRKRIRDI